MAGQHLAQLLALQYGAPVELIADRLQGQRFEPAGLTDDHEIPEAMSIMDYVARRLAADFVPTSPARPE
jgi:ribonucleoside-diphosphate reductase alpha chain